MELVFKPYGNFINFPERILTILNDFAQFNLPIVISEFDAAGLTGI